MIVYEGYKAALAALFNPLLGTASVFVVKADFDGTDGALVLADLTEADFPGYARQNYLSGLSSADLDPHPWGRVISTTFTFQPSGLTVPQTIYGIGVRTSHWNGFTFIDRLVILEHFDAPIILAADTDKIQRGVDVYARNFTP